MKKRKQNELTADRLREVLSYDAFTGDFRRLGDIAGCVREDGYRIISVDGTRYRAHRLVWLYVYGRFPDEEIDHIDRNPANNALGNLRPASGSQNLANAGLGDHNTSGFKGVSWDKQKRKWRAQIMVRGQRIRLGRFESPEVAHAVYMAAAVKHFGEFACDGN